VVFVGGYPTTATGKIRRVELRRMAATVLVAGPGEPVPGETAPGETVLPGEPVPGETARPGESG
jgi:hypothetical protein